MEELEGGGPPSDGMGAMDVDEEAGALAEEIDDDDAGEGPSTNAFSQYASSSKVTPVAGKSSTNKQNGKASVRTSSDKGKGKGKGKATGEEGVLYTPLEKQIMALKEEHPGVLLIIEVGYKLKFYGEDARIASRELNIVSVTAHTPEFEIDSRSSRSWLHELSRRRPDICIFHGHV